MGSRAHTYYELDGCTFEDREEHGSQGENYAVARAADEEDADASSDDGVGEFLEEADDAYAGRAHAGAACDTGAADAESGVERARALNLNRYRSTGRRSSAGL